MVKQPKERRTLVVIVSLFIMNVVMYGTVTAHDWACGTRGYHWNRWGTPDIWVYNTVPTKNYTQANNALAEWTADTILDLYNATAHTDVSLYDANLGSSGPGGQTTIENSSGCHITHTHSVGNSTYVDNYSPTQKHALYCHELGHSWGLWHMGSLDECLGSGTGVNSHSIDDISAEYSASHSTH